MGDGRSIIEGQAVGTLLDSDVVPFRETRDLLAMVVTRGLDLDGESMGLGPCGGQPSASVIGAELGISEGAPAVRNPAARETERQRDSDRARERQRGRQRQTETERQRDRQVGQWGGRKKPRRFRNTACLCVGVLRGSVGSL